MKKFSLYGLLFALISATSAEVPGFGQCPKVQVMQNFDISQFLGTWYLMCAYPDKFAFDARCASATFSWSQGMGGGLNIFSKHVSFGKEKKFLGSANLIQSGVLAVTFPAAPRANAYYNILDTDYNNFAVIFACNNYYGIANGQSLWILGRRRYLDPSTMQRAMDVVNYNQLSKLLLKHVDQNCDNPHPYADTNGYNGNGYNNNGGGGYYGNGR